MLKEQYARWMYEWETRLTTRDENRVVRPLEWGFEWIEPFLEAHGFQEAVPGPEVVRDPVAAEAAMARINQLLVRNSDKFFGYERPTDFRLEERHPQLFPTNVRPETLGQGRGDARAGRRGQAGDGAVSALYIAGADALPRERPSECPLVSCAAHKDPARPKQAIVVLPQWNSDGLGHNSLCTIFNRMGVSALRLSMPYHDIRRPAELERSDYASARTSGGRSRPAARRWWIYAAVWTGWRSKVTSTSAYWEQAWVRAIRFWPAHTTRASA